MWVKKENNKPITLATAFKFGLDIEKYQPEPLVDSDITAYLAENGALPVLAQIEANKDDPDTCYRLIEQALTTLED